MANILCSGHVKASTTTFNALISACEKGSQWQRASHLHTCWSDGMWTDSLQYDSMGLCENHFGLLFLLCLNPLAGGWKAIVMERGLTNWILTRGPMSYQEFCKDMVVKGTPGPNWMILSFIWPIFFSDPVSPFGFPFPDMFIGSRSLKVRKGPER